jgi:transcriptional regulator with XRE-family HTH domain
MSASEHMRAQVAAAIRAARLERGWTQRQVSASLDVSPVTIARWERGITLPYPYHHQALCTLFGKTREELGFLSAEQTTDQPPGLGCESTDEQRQAASLGLYACLRGWMESLSGRSERADFYFTQASKVFARGAPAMENFVWALRCALVLRQSPSPTMRKQLLHALLHARELREIDRILMIETLSRIEEDLEREQESVEEQTS